MRSFMLVLLLLLSLTGTRAADAGDARTDLSLVLAVDASGSISDEEYAFQMQSIAEALGDPQVREAMRSGPAQKIEVLLMVWGDGEITPDVGRWYTLSSDAEIDRFVEMVRTHPRRAYGNTGIGSAIERAVTLLEERRAVSDRLVINVSGDGRESVLPRRKRAATVIQTARKFAEQQDVTINGLAIETQEPDLADWYRANVQTGVGSFVVSVKSYQDFASAMRRKLTREITWQPLVASAAP
ncbi:MAG: DUF1194 domain-containing protein [Hyphomicrobiales bacterium]